jgi:hypothetical protein
MAVERSYKAIMGLSDDDLVTWTRQAAAELEASPEDAALGQLIDAGYRELDARAAKAWGEAWEASR